MDPIDTLLEVADMMARQPTPRPDFFVAPSLLRSVEEEGWMEVRQNNENPQRGQGWFARRDIPAGTRILVSKPLAMVMNWEVEEEEARDGEEFDEEDDEDEWEDIDDEEEECGMDTNADGGGNDGNDDDNDESEKGSPTNGRLILRLIKSLCEDVSLWQKELSHLFPRDEETARWLPPWQCRHAGIKQEINEAWKTLEEKQSQKLSLEVLAQIRARLPLVVRYNALSVETSPELFCHPSPDVGYVTLSGTALYSKASFFNHSSLPNVSRWAVGDVMFMVTNQPVAADTELCISYLEHEVLCEDASKRSQLLDMDFMDIHNGAAENDEHNNSDDNNNTQTQEMNEEEDDDGPDSPVVDAEVQQELMDMPPMERLEAIEQLLLQATGGEGSGDDDDDEGNDMKDHGASSSSSRWFLCDAHQLRILQALSLDALGRHEAALKVWQTCIAFVDARMPPLDESGMALRVQAALCAQACGSSDSRNRNSALEWAGQVLRHHNALFGGGVERFHRRYRREVELTLRPDSQDAVRGDAALDALFPFE